MRRKKMTALAILSAAWFAGCGLPGETGGTGGDGDVASTQSAVSIGGLIEAKYDQLGGAGGPLGHNLTDELTTAFNTGRYNLFDHGRILWKFGAAEAFSVYGGIDGGYSHFGFEWGPFGFPVKDEFSRCCGAPSTIPMRQTNFEHGLIRMNTNTSNPAWPVLTQSSSSNLTTMGWPRVTNGFISQQVNGDGCLNNFAGAGFSPGARVSVYLNNPDTSSQIAGSATVASNGTFTMAAQSGSTCFVSTTIKRINGGATIEARDTAGNRAVIFIPTGAGGNYTGQIF